MKFLCFALVLVAFVAQGESATVLESKTKNAIVYILESLNNLTDEVETYVNNRLIDRLQNETSVQEWSVNIQAQVTNTATNIVILGFELYKKITLDQSPSEAERKYLGCVSDSESTLLDIVDNATRLNAWCNNKHAADLARGFQETTAALLEINAEMLGYAKSLDSCIFGDTICLAEYAAKLVALVREEISEGAALYSAFEHVKSVYKIMFGTDVPTCGREIFVPILKAGIDTVKNNIKQCTAA